MFKPARVVISVISYHTEISDKVNELLTPLIPEELKDELEIQVVLMRGQYRDRIRMHSLEVTKKKHLDIFLQHLITSLDKNTLEELTRTVEERIDERGNTLYFRLDKFAAAQGIYRLTEGSDVIKVTIKYDIYKPTPFREIWEQLLVKTGVK